MNIKIEVYLIANNSRFMQAGSFTVRTAAYKQDPNKEAARVARDWIKQIKRGMMYPIEIIKVFYDGKNDITELCKE